MSLFEEHKAERRTRIIAEARKLVEKHGYDGLTMRDLAAAARVSVPTLYNLFGGKDAILAAELERMAVVITSRILAHQKASFFARGMVAFEAGMELVLEHPAFYRAIMRLFLTSPETGPIRRKSEDGYIALMAANLRAAQQAGQLVEWVDVELVARHMYAAYTSCFLGWGIGDLDDETFRIAAASAICHVLIGVTRGAFHDEVETRLKQLYREAGSHKPKPNEVPHAKRSSHRRTSD